MDKVRQKLRRRISHKDKDINFDDADSADEETQSHLNKEIEEHEKEEKYPEGRPGSLLNRMISYGNKKTEDEIATGQKVGQTTTTKTTTTSTV